MKKVLTKDTKCSNIFLADAKCKSKKEKSFKKMKKVLDKLEKI